MAEYIAKQIERVLREGAAVCAKDELLVALIGGNTEAAEKTAAALLEKFGSMRRLAVAGVVEMCEGVPGMSEKVAARVRAALELGRRSLDVEEPVAQIKTPEDAFHYLYVEMARLEQEEIHILLLDTRNRIIKRVVVYRGSLNTASMRICELFREAIRENAASIVMAHNHPSGDPAPSAEDVSVTSTIVTAGKILDIALLDHIVIGGTRYVSLKERGLGFG